MLQQPKSLRLLVFGAVAMLAAGAAQVAGSGPAAAADYFNGFETDTNGWSGPIVRVPSGTDGIPSKTGSFHANVDGCARPAPPNCSSAFTFWGGEELTFPPAGYVTSVDVYLDFPPPAGSSLQNDMRFDWTSAIGTPGGNHRRDFVFNAGYYDDLLPPGAGPRYVISASNNATRSGAFPKNPGRDPFVISVEGWYTFEHRFDNVGGVLVVTLTIKNAAGLPLHSWVLSDPSDVIGVTVGGNQYGWFANNELDFLAIDNSRKDQSGSQSVDHFACYDAHEKQPNLPKTIVTLQDQFGSSTVELHKPDVFCTPVDKNGEGIIFPDFNLVCFDAHKGGDPKADLTVENQFGEQNIEARKLKMVCVPSTD
jgi:hypothetical protein